MEQFIFFNRTIVLFLAETKGTLPIMTFDPKLTTIYERAKKRKLKSFLYLNTTRHLLVFSFALEILKNITNYVSRGDYKGQMQVVDHVYLVITSDHRLSISFIPFAKYLVHQVPYRTSMRHLLSKQVTLYMKPWCQRTILSQE